MRVLAFPFYLITYTRHCNNDHRLSSSLQLCVCEIIDNAELLPAITSARLGPFTSHANFRFFFCFSHYYKKKKQISQFSASYILSTPSAQQRKKNLVCISY